MKHVFLLVFLSMSFFAWSEDITLKKIKFIIDDDVYIWNTEEDIPQNPVDNKTEPEYLKSFFSWKPGDLIDSEKLEKEVVRTQQRIIDTNLFYSVKVSIIPPKKYPESRSIIIQVTEGFRLRFGGGNAYAEFGIKNIGGNGHSFLATAGYNIINFDYINNLIINNLYWGTNINYEYIDNTANIKTFLGYRITPDLRFSVGVRGNYSKSGLLYPSIIPTFKNDTTFKLTENILLRSTLYGYLDINLINSICSIKREGNIKLNINFNNKISIAFQSGVGFIDSDESGRLFNLYDHSNRSIRSGYKETHLSVLNYILGSGEVRYFLPPFFIAPLLDVRTSLFIFTDYGYMENEIKDAYGIGGRIYFDSPVFTGFTFSYGWNHLGKGRFMFTGTMGF